MKKPVASGRIRRTEASALTRPPGNIKSTHGGKRAGAGGPKLLEQPVRRTVYLDQRHVDYIDEAARHYSNSFSEILRGIINDDMGWPETER